MRVTLSVAFAAALWPLWTTAQPAASEPVCTGPANTSHPVVRRADFERALASVAELTQGLSNGLVAYRADLQRALAVYGLGIADLDHSAKNEHTGRLKRAVFATMLRSAGVALEPDPLRQWQALEALLNRYQPAVQRATEVVACADIVAVGQENIAPPIVLSLKKQWQAAIAEAERARNAAAGDRPLELHAGETFIVSARLRAELTYSGQVSGGHRFLLSVLAPRRGGTSVSTRALLLASDPGDPARYGQVLRTHDYPDYSVAGSPAAGAAARARDWVWRTVAAADMPELPSVNELARAIERVGDAGAAIDQAVADFRALTAQAVRQNDAALRAEAKALHRKTRLPEQDLKAYFPDVRETLYADRALWAGDARFQAAHDAVLAARRNADRQIEDGSRQFQSWNRISVQAVPNLPWKAIDRLAVDFMRAAEEVWRADARVDAFLPPIAPGSDVAVVPRVGASPRVMVAHVKSGVTETGAGVLSLEYILLDVHSVLKGGDRREYSSEVIRSSAKTGIHRLQSVVGPDPVESSGSIVDAFKALAEESGLEIP